MALVLAGPGLPDNLRSVDISLIGAPTDVGASVVGCRLGPGALRLAGIQQSLETVRRDRHRPR